MARLLLAVTTQSSHSEPLAPNEISCATGYNRFLLYHLLEPNGDLVLPLVL